MRGARRPGFNFSCRFDRTAAQYLGDAVRRQPRTAGNGRRPDFLARFAVCRNRLRGSGQWPGLPCRFRRGLAATLLPGGLGRAATRTGPRNITSGVHHAFARRPHRGLSVASPVWRVGRLGRTASETQGDRARLTRKTPTRERRQRRGGGRRGARAADAWHRGHDRSAVPCVRRGHQRQHSG